MQVAIITGAGSGIGLGTAKMLHAAGMAIVGVGRDAAKLATLAATIDGRRGGAYSAAKGGLPSLTEHIACDYAPQGIRANCVAPGVTMTDMVRHRFDDEMFKRVNFETTPFPRLGEVEDIASTIAF